MGNHREKTAMKKALKIGVPVLLVFLLALWLALGYIAAYLFTMPSNRPIRDEAHIGGVPVEDVTILTEDGVTLSAWHLRKNTERAIIFAGGITSNRRQGLSRAAFFLEKGWSVLLLDLRGTGESQAAVVTMGWEERKDLLAARYWLESENYRIIAANGISLGAATIAYTFDDDPGWDFVILESCYDTIDNAFNNRLAMFSVPAWFASPVRWWASWRMGAGPELLRPAEYLRNCAVPALIVAGDSEPELKTAETRAIYEACASPIKKIHLFKGGHHENFLGRYPEEYKSLVSDFLEAVEARRAGEEKEKNAA
jgi:uncharacterized protein